MEGTGSLLWDNEILAKKKFVLYKIAVFLTLFMLTLVCSKNKWKNSVYYEKHAYFYKNKRGFSAYRIQIFGFCLILSS